MSKHWEITIKLEDGTVPVPERFKAVSDAYMAADRVRIVGPNIFWCSGGIVGDGFTARWEIKE